MMADGCSMGRHDLVELAGKKEIIGFATDFVVA